MTLDKIRPKIEEAFEEREQLSPAEAPEDLRRCVEHVIQEMERGHLRVAEPGEDGWTVVEWLKKAVLLYFRLHANHVVESGYTRFFDKVPLRFGDYDEEAFARLGARIVPPAIVRAGAHIAPDVVLMPCYINIGAYVGRGSMVDTWATVGSCAQIGEGVHISGGAGIGGVLEPLQASPTIIEDGCFIGARSEIVEGIVVERGSVIAMGVFIGASTRIYDRERDEIVQGRVPAGSVVVPGSLPSEDGRYSLNCAVIVKRVDEKTRAKVGINELLREAAHDR